MRSVRREFRFVFPVLFVAGALLAGLVVMFLWNDILVPALHVGALTYWQGVGLLVLSRILLGGLRGGGSWGGHRNAPPWKVRWQNMTDEEKIQVKNAWKDRCGQFRKEPYGNAQASEKDPVIDQK